ncbi:MAG: hypothetical protein OXI63_22010 [Candidatus Poribacteria bacterium]|nr:hypothetical protein [Candidatus Poribacteria bacterium]
MENRFDSIEEAFDAIRQAAEAGDIEAVLEAELAGRRALNEFRDEYYQDADGTSEHDDASETRDDPAPTEEAAGKTDASRETGDEELKQMVADNVVEFKVPDIIEAVMRTPFIRDAREQVMIPEKGTTVSVQAFRLTDSKFKVLDEPALNKVIELTRIDNIKWTAEDMDCEDIARAFVQRCSELGFNSAGRFFSWSGGHCFVVCLVNVDGNVEFRFIEPQVDKILTDSDLGKGMYTNENCLIIIS